MVCGAIARSAVLAMAFGVLLVAARASAHVPVPDSVLDPRTAPEAWNVLRLATDNINRLLKAGRLSQVNDQLSLCGPALRTLPKVAAPAASQPLAVTKPISSGVQPNQAGPRA